MKIVISGGLGYVGGRLSKYFADQGHEVSALSRQAGNLDHVVFPSNMEVLHPEKVMEEKSALRGADVFIHLAAMNEHDCVKYTEKAIEVNVTGTVRWLEAAKVAGIPRFVYFSTAHVYGKPLEGLYDEKSLARPVHPYAITHRCAEDYVLAYSAERGMSNMVVRLTNAFGGPAFPTADRWTLLVNDLCLAAVVNGKMTLLSDGLQKRDFVCMEDVCRATLHLINLPDDATRGQIFNLARGHSQSVWEMALEVKCIAEKTLGESVELERKNPSSKGGSTLSISAAKLLASGFLLRNNVEQEIRSTLWFFGGRAIEQANRDRKEESK